MTNNNALLSHTQKETNCCLIWGEKWRRDDNVINYMQASEQLLVKIQWRAQKFEAITKVYGKSWVYVIYKNNGHKTFQLWYCVYNVCVLWCDWSAFMYICQQINVNDPKCHCWQSNNKLQIDGMLEAALNIGWIYSKNSNKIMTSRWRSYLNTSWWQKWIIWLAICKRTIFWSCGSSILELIF